MPRIRWAMDGTAPGRPEARSNPAAGLAAAIGLGATIAGAVPGAVPRLLAAGGAVAAISRDGPAAAGKG